MEIKVGVMKEWFNVRLVKVERGGRGKDFNYLFTWTLKIKKTYLIDQKPLYRDRGLERTAKSRE